jgi:acetyltransferase-like isoleucine patch superfamily enzyme
MGRHSYDPPKIMEDANKVVIGNFSSIAKGVVIDGGFQHRRDFVTTYPFPCKFPDRFSRIPGYPHVKGDVVIGSDVWIGQDVTVMSGLSIGDGCVVGTGAIVTKSLPPFSIAVGVPARVVKYRFFDWQIEGLMKIRWWDWPDNKVFSVVPELMSKGVDSFIERYGGGRA